MLLAFNKPYGVISQFTPDGSGNRTLAEIDGSSRASDFAIDESENRGVSIGPARGRHMESSKGSGAEAGITPIVKARLDWSVCFPFCKLRLHFRPSAKVRKSH